MNKKKKIVRAALIKAVPRKWHPAHNWRLFETLALQAVGRNADIIVTPECFLDGYVAPDKKGWSLQRFRGIAESIVDGEYILRAREFACKHAVHLVFGFTELSGESCFNAAALIGSDGCVIGCYHKIHLLDHDEVYAPGDELPVWETPHGRIGIMICADRRWPETARTLRVRGTELIINPTYGMWHLDNEWWMRTRSYENELFICYTHPRVAFITGPGGEIAAKLMSNLPDVLVHDIDLSAVSDDMFRYRRPDLYDNG